MGLIMKYQIILHTYIDEDVPITNPDYIFDTEREADKAASELEYNFRDIAIDANGNDVWVTVYRYSNPDGGDTRYDTYTGYHIEPIKTEKNISEVKKELQTIIKEEIKNILNEDKDYSTAYHSTFYKNIDSNKIIKAIEFLKKKIDDSIKYGRKKYTYKNVPEHMFQAAQELEKTGNYKLTRRQSSNVHPIGKGLVWDIDIEKINENNVITEYESIDTVMKGIKKPNEVFIGYNTTGYQWEDLSIDKYAMLFFNKITTEIRLVIYELVENDGINAYKTRGTKFDKIIGKISTFKPSVISPILKVYQIQKSSAGYPFKGKWTTPKGKEVNLSEIIPLLRNFLMKQSLLKQTGTEYDIH